MYKIAIIIPYFGKFPEWMRLFLYSCHLNYRIDHNVFIDWIIFTDNSPIENIYPNTKFYYLSFKDYCDRVSDSLHINFHPLTPYKFCDLKPFYGIIHKKELQDYSHWGFGDLDLCYGNLSLVINKMNLRKYRLITTHADRIAGHFTVIEKKSIYTDLCLKISNWEIKLLDENVLGLDEMDFTNLVRPTMTNWLRMYRYLARPFGVGIYKFMRIPNMIHNLYADSLIKEYYTSPLPKNGEQWIWNIETNTLINSSGRSIPYLHFLFFKKTPFWKTPNYWKENFFHIDDKCLKGQKGFVIFNNKSVTYKNCL